MGNIPQFLLTPSNPAPQNTTYYFHYAAAPVSAGGGTTNYIANSSAQFDFATQQQAMTNSFYKVNGQLTMSFYSYPAFSAPASFNGTWQVFIWANSSSYRLATFTLEFLEYAVGNGTAAWDSGRISNPIVTSAVGAYLDVPVYSYNITSHTPLAHTFAKNSMLNVIVSVSNGSNGVRVWYDSASYPSKMILPLVSSSALGGPFNITTALVLLLIGVVVVVGSVVFFVKTSNDKKTGRSGHNTTT